MTQQFGSLRVFQPTSEKVYQLDAHPTQPWIALADARDTVYVWDWQHDEILYEASGGGANDRRLTDAMLQRSIERDPSHQGPRLESEAPTPTPRTEKVGSVRGLRFVDEDVQAAEVHSHYAFVWKPVATPARFRLDADAPPSVSGSRWLCICYENRAAFVDMTSLRSRDISKAVFDNRSLTSLTVLPGIGETTTDLPTQHGPCLAFGCSDGVIRILSLQTFQVVRRIGSASKGAVACLQVVIRETGAWGLLAGTSDGLITVSEPGSHEGREVPPVKAIKAHDGGVLSVTLAHSDGGKPRLVSSGADRSLAVWDLQKLEEVARLRPLSKLPCHSVRYWVSLEAPDANLIVAGKESRIIGVDRTVKGGDPRVICDVAAFLPSLPKDRKLKSYALLVHPLLTHLVIMATNVGVALVEFESRWAPAHALLPAQQSATPAGAASRNLIVAVARRKLVGVAFHVQPQGPGAVEVIDGSKAPIAVQTKHVLGDAAFGQGTPLLYGSTSGRWLAVLWPESGVYAVFSTSTSSWKVVESGGATSLGWHTHSDTLAILTAPVAVAAPKLAKSSSSRKKKEALAAAQQAATAAAAAAKLSVTVEVKRFQPDGTVSIITSSVTTPFSPVSHVTGGVLLGLTYNKSAQPNARFNPSDGRPVTVTSVMRFQLYSWDTLAPVSKLLPVPNWVEWDSKAEFVAFAYPQYIALFTVAPTFKFLSQINVSNATSAVWHRRQLFLVTPTTIMVYFIHMDAHNPDASPFIVPMRLASFSSRPSLTAGPSLQASLPEALQTPGSMLINDQVGSAAVSTAFPSEQLRPAGALAMLGVRDGALWVFDSYSRVFALSLAHPGIRTRCLTAYGDANGAIKWSTKLSKVHHDDLAQFMIGMGHALDALQLSGLSKLQEYKAAVKAGQLVRALDCLDALAGDKDEGDTNQSSSQGDALWGAIATSQVGNMPKVTGPGIGAYADEYLSLIDSADAVGLRAAASSALQRLASTKPTALPPEAQKGLLLRLAKHGDGNRVRSLGESYFAAGRHAEAATAAALLNDLDWLERILMNSGRFAQAALLVHSHRRNSFQQVLQQWNRSLAGPVSMDQALSALGGGDISAQNVKPSVQIMQPVS